MRCLTSQTAPGQKHSMKRGTQHKGFWDSMNHATQCNKFRDCVVLPVQWILGFREESCPVQGILCCLRRQTTGLLIRS